MTELHVMPVSEPVLHVADPETVRVQLRDVDGICIALGDDRWVHLSWECAQELSQLLAMCFAVRNVVEKAP